MADWEHFHHGADIGIRGYGTTKAAAFAAAAKALTAVTADLNNIKAQQAVSINVSAPDDELLLADWLNALVYEMAVQNMLFCQFDVNIVPGALTARAYGEPVNIARHQPVVEIKGATYTELAVTQNQSGRWCAQCVVDV